MVAGRFAPAPADVHVSNASIVLLLVATGVGLQAAQGRGRSGFHLPEHGERLDRLVAQHGPRLGPGRRLGLAPLCGLEFLPAALVFLIEAACLVFAQREALALCAAVVFPIN